MATTTILRPIETLLAGVRDSTGAPVSSGKARFYSPNTIVTQTVYQDAEGITAYPQPIELNAAGQATVYALENVRMVVKDSTETTTYIDTTITAIRDTQVMVDVDGFNGGDQTTLDVVLESADASFGEGFQYKASSSTLAVARNYVDVINEKWISVKAFGATGNGTTDDAPAIKAAIALLKTIPGGVLWFPIGTYKYNDELLLDFDGWSMRGAGAGKSVLRAGVSNKGIRLDAVTYAEITGLGIDSLSALSTVPCITLDGSGYVHIHNNVMSADGGELVKASSCNSIYIQNNSCVVQSARHFSLRSGSQDWHISGNLCIGSTAVEIFGGSSRGFVNHNAFETTTGIRVDASASGQYFVFGPNIFPNTTTPLEILATHDLRAVLLDQAGNTGGTGDSSLYDVASAGSISHNGKNFLNITGTTTINNLQNSYAGHLVTMQFNANVTITHAGATVGNFRPFRLSGSANFAATANDQLTVRYVPAGYWIEVSRTII